MLLILWACLLVPAALAMIFIGGFLSMGPFAIFGVLLLLAGVPLYLRERYS